MHLTARRKTRLPAGFRDELLALDGGARLWQTEPVYFVPTGAPLFSSAAEMLRIGEERGWSLGQLARAYEAQLLGMSENDVTVEALRRYDVMTGSVERGLRPDFTGLQLLPACAGAIFDAEAEGQLTVHYQTPDGSANRQVPLDATGQLKTATFFLDNALFSAGGMNYDLIVEGEPEAVVSMVRVVRL